jgi:hypothetical protein
MRFNFQPMVCMKFLSTRLFVLALAGVCFGARPAAAQPVQHLSTTQPGGMPGLPVMGGISSVTNGVQLIWDGSSGYYQVFQKSNSLNAPWLALGKATNLVRTATITKLYSNAFFRVSGPAPKYAGVKVCISCHNSICRYETNTAHADAFSNRQFNELGGQTNASCLACHTVGYGLPTGFVNATATPLLAGVQCENCHGPAANHAASPDDPSVVPRVEIAATVCGGCHTASHTTFTTAPTFEEWSASEHAAVTPDALQVMASSTNNISSCGVCHSGSARLALIGGKNPAVTLVNDFNVALTCAVCHDPHQTNANPVQLRNPIFSTNTFHFASADVASVSAFTNKYNASANINLCAQCHNDRAAAWTDTSRAPHHSVQYNFLLGGVGELPDGTATFNPGSHAGLPDSAFYSASGTFYLTNQCVSCHMPTTAPSGSHRHTFATGNAVCANCHDGSAAQAFLTPYLSNKVSTLIFTLNRWAAIKAPASLRTNGVVAWEYSTAGGLTWQTNAAGIVTGWVQNESVNFTGPDAAGQSLLKTNYPNILRARFNLYLFLNDGSFGVHNPFFALDLLNAAEDWVALELNK